MADQTLTVRVIGDESDYIRSLRTSAKATQRFTASFGTFVKGALIFEGVRTGLDALGASFRKGVSEASGLNEEINKTDVIFARSAEAILSWSKTTADGLGLSRTQALAAAGGFGQMLQTAGLTEKQSASFSRSLVELAADMASFNNIDPTEALLKLRSGLAGEAEPLRTVGVLLSANRVAQEAYRLGIAKTGEELTEQQKVQARYSLIMKDTAKQQGDFVRTSDSLANAQRRIRASLSDAAGAIGNALLPALARLTSGFADALPAIQQSFARVAAVIGPAISNVVEAFSSRLPELQRIAASILDPLRERVLPILREFADTARGVFDAVVGVFSNRSGELRQILDNLGQVLTNVWTIARPTIVFLFERALPAALNIAIPIIEKLTGVTKTMSDIFVRVVSVIVKALDVFLGALSRVADAASHLPFIGDQFAGVADKVNASRESLREFSDSLDAIDGRKVSVSIAVDVTTGRREEGALGRSSDGVKKATEDATKQATADLEAQKDAARDIGREATATTTETKKAKTAAEKQREAFDALMATIGLRRDRAAATAGLKDDIAAAVATKKALEDQLKIQKDNVDLQRQHLQATQELNALRSQQRQGRQFEALGLTASGDKRVPGVGALRNRLGNLREQIKGTVLDTAKTRSQLNQIAKVLSGKFGAVGKQVREAILGMFNDISNALGQGSSASQGPETKFAKGGFGKLIENVTGLSPEQIKELRQAFSQFGAGGTVPGKGFAAFGMAFPQPVSATSGGAVVIENRLYIDGVEQQITRQQQIRRERTAAQRRGVRPGIGGV